MVRILHEDKPNKTTNKHTLNYLCPINRQYLWSPEARRYFSAPPLNFFSLRGFWAGVGGGQT